MVWGYIQYGGVREICRVEGNINSLKYQEVLATSCIPKHKRGQILQNGMKEEAWKRKPTILDELWEACKTAFFAIPDDFVNKLYESLSNRMDAVLQAHRSHTRY